MGRERGLRSAKRCIANGDDCCAFKWINCGFDDAAELDAIMEKRARLLSSITKNYLYAIGHLLSALHRVLRLEHGLITGDAIIDNTLEEYAKTFSKGKADLVREEAKKNFMLVE